MSLPDTFQKWIPAEGIGVGYDVDDIRWSRDGLVFDLIPDGKEKASCGLQIIWDSGDVLSVHITDETYRADCWGLDFEKDGRFYLSRDSEYLHRFRQKSPLFPENALHFLIVGTNIIADVLAKGYPEAHPLERS